ncbi:phenylalanine--tRNA ligase subunit beta, partial [Chloroflexota bacterium]
KLAPEPLTLKSMPIHLANPMTADQEYLRPNLRGHLLTALVANRRHEEGRVLLFELGKIYLPREKDLPQEPDMLCAVLSGDGAAQSWLGGIEPPDFFAVKGMVEGLFTQLGIIANFEPGDDESLNHVKQAAVVIEGKKLGVVGELHPKVADNFEIVEPVYLFEINVSELLPHTTTHKTFQPIPRFPGIVRDLALVVDTATTHRQVHDIIKSFALVKEAIIFDVYSGKQVSPGKKSLAYRVVYQSPDRTLTDEEIDRIQKKILNKLVQVLGATLRA